MRAAQSNPRIKARYEGLTERVAQLSDDCGFPELSQPRFNGIVRPQWDALSLPATVKKPTTWAIWNDLFHKDVPLDFILGALWQMQDNSHHTYLIPTKRAHRMANLITGLTGTLSRFPSHIWLGVTAENQEMADLRIPELMKVNANRWVSVEPCLSRIDLTQWLYCDKLVPERSLSNEREREGISGAGGDGVVFGSLRGRHDLEDGEVCGGKSYWRKAIYEDDPTGTSRAISLSRASENHLHGRFAEANAGLCPPDHMDGGESQGYTGLSRNQSQRRESNEQQTIKFGDDHAEREYSPCRESTWQIGPQGTARRAEYGPQSNAGTSLGNSHPGRLKDDDARPNSETLWDKSGNRIEHTQPEDVAAHPVRRIDWVVCGPETGKHKRPCDPEWIADLYDQCKAAGVPFFDKRKVGWLAREMPEGV
jgi:protein gp37